LGESLPGGTCLSIGLSVPTRLLIMSTAAAQAALSHWRSGKKLTPWQLMQVRSSTTRPGPGG
jgi:hypothetical protein